MSELEEFVNRELELKRTLPFGEWLRHIKDSHEQLCRMILAHPMKGKTIQIAVLDGDDACASSMSTYELPADCHRVIVDVRHLCWDVWGFRLTDDLAGNEQINGKLVAKDEGPLLG